MLRRKPLHPLRELGRYVKLNYFCHGSVLQVFWFLAQIQPCENSTSHATPIRTDSGWNRSIGVSSEVPYTRRMSASTCSCSLNSHTKLDSLIVVWDATVLSFDCQTTVSRMSRTRVSDIVRSFRESHPDEHLSFAPQSLCQSEQDRFTLASHIFSGTGRAFRWWGIARRCYSSG